MPVIPLPGKVFVRPHKQDRSGSFLLPDAYKSKHVDVGVIEAIGPDQVFLEPGDVVAFLPWQAETLYLENPYASFDDSVYVLADDQIEAIIETEGDSFRILPTLDRVLVLPDAPKAERIFLPFASRSIEAIVRADRHGLLTLPHNAASTPSTGTLLSCGPLVRDLSPTQRVLFAPGDPILNNLSRSREHGTELEVNGKKFFIFREGEIFATLH